MGILPLVKLLKRHRGSIPAREARRGRITGCLDKPLVELHTRTHEPAMVLASDGWWLLEFKDGLERSNYLGNLGTVESVRASCRNRGLKVIQLVGHNGRPFPHP